jgi:hypothetical protein
MRLLGAVIFLCFAAFSAAERILLVPLDNRPAAGQFAQMIGSIDGAEVQMPPYETLGRFTKPGNPEQILDWMEKQDYTDISDVVVSADMIAYGGLIASRVNNVPVAEATARLKRFVAIKKKAPKTRFFVFASVMRMAPTATKTAGSWRMILAKYVGIRNEYERTKKPSLAVDLSRLRSKIPRGQIEKYDATRMRNHEVLKQLIKLSMPSLDYVVMGQDDAQPYGPHIPETKELKALVQKLSIGGKIYFCEGVDQNSNVLVSRALLKQANWTPRVRVIYSDPYGQKKIGVYESKTIQETVKDQIIASGARPAMPNGPHDYTLYVNTPDRRDAPFSGFIDEMQLDLEQGGKVCLADINLGKDGTCDSELYSTLRKDGQIMKIVAFAGWNTPGNTLGTAIPAANVALLAERRGGDPIKREVAQKAFLLHRVVNDVIYHRYTRPQAYGLIDVLPGASRDETYGASFNQVDAFVRKDMRAQLEKTFKETLFGLKFETPQGQYEFAELDDVKVFLPWPRAYEVRVEFELKARPFFEVSKAAQSK